MTTSKTIGLLALGLTCLSFAAIGDAAAQNYPNKPVHWIVSYPAGGSTDITARLFGQYLSEKLGQQFIIENRPGAGNNLGTEQALRAAPDGYTLFLVNPANASMRRSTRAEFQFHPRPRADRRLHPRSQ